MTELVTRDLPAPPPSRPPAGRPARVLVLARSHPNPAFPLLGLWTAGLVRCAATLAEVKVVSPVPLAPPLPAHRALRAVPRRRWADGVEVLHPRLVVGPGHTLYASEAAAYAAAVLGVVERLRRRFAFDLVHAHFGYPDGVAGALVARRHGVPLVISEHVPWSAGMARMPLVRRQAAWAARAAAAAWTAKSSSSVAMKASAAPS